DDDDLLKAAGVQKAKRYRNPLTGEMKSEEAYQKLADKARLDFIPEEGFWNYAKYMHLTMHAQDAEAFEVMSRVNSLAWNRAEKHGEERKPILSWRDIEELGAANITMGSSCLIGCTSRHLIDHDSF